MADIDGRSLISRDVHRIAKFVRDTMIGVGILGMIAQGALYWYFSIFSYIGIFLGVGVATIGFILREGVLRNMLLSIIGAAIAYVGFTYDVYWAIGLGLFIMIAPWFAHRGFTHTIWATIIWIVIAHGVEGSVGIKGITFVAGAGYLSHLTADTVVFLSWKRVEGVKWFYPIWNKEIRL